MTKLREELQEAINLSKYNNPDHNSFIIDEEEAATKCESIAQAYADKQSMDFLDWFMTNGISIMMNGEEQSGEKLIDLFKQQTK